MEIYVAIRIFDYLFIGDAPEQDVCENTYAIDDIVDEDWIVWRWTH